MNILYVHGLGSGKNSSTLELIKKFFPVHTIHSIEINECPYDSIMKIQRYVDTNKIDIAIGCSYGGYCLSQVTGIGHRFLVNPAFMFDKIVKDRIGYGTYEFFCEREDKRKTYILDDAVVDIFNQHRASIIANNKNTTLLFSTCDDFVGADIQLKNIKFALDYGYNNITMSDEFAHRINHNTLINIQREMYDNEICY